MPSTMNLADRMRANAWHLEVDPSEPLGNATTMLSLGERKMLHWLARHMDISGGVVDAGAFLGGSTLALATGLAANPRVRDKRFRIRSYDMFSAPNDQLVLGMIGHDKRPGDTVLDIYARSLEKFLDMVAVHAGDITLFEAPTGPIDVLFIDVAKTRDVNRFITTKYFPQLIPEHSVLIQQDYNDHSCPWVNTAMEFFADHFTHVADENGSRVYIAKRAIPDEALRRFAALGIDEEISLMNAAIRKESRPISRYFDLIGLGWLISERSGADAAVHHLRNLDMPQPWESETPYVERVISSIRWVAEKGGLGSVHDDYFVRKN